MAAGQSSLTELRNECVKTKAAADPDPDATHQRIHRERRLRFFTDAEGGANLTARTTVDQMATITAAVDDMTEEMFTLARIEGRHEPRDAYAMDALAEICNRYVNGHTPTTPPDKKRPRRRMKYLGIVRGRPRSAPPRPGP